MTLSEMLKALKQLIAWIEWERESLDDFHKYSQKYGFSPGSNVFTNAFEDALRFRGVTVAQWRAEQEPTK